MPSSCCLFTFKSIWLFALILLMLCMSRNASCRSRPLSYLHQEGTGRRAAASVLQECFGRWHVYTQSGCFTSSSRNFIDLFIMPSFYLGWTETPCLDSLLYRNPAAARELLFPVLILQEYKDGLTEADENLLVQFVLSTSFPLTPSASHQHHFPHTSISFSFLLPLLDAPFPFSFCWLNSSYSMNLWEEENIGRKIRRWPKWSQDRFDSKQGTSSIWARHMLLLIWREQCCQQGICGEHRLSHVLPPRRWRQPHPANRFSWLFPFLKGREKRGPCTSSINKSKQRHN